LIDVHTHLTGESSDDWKQDEIDRLLRDSIEKGVVAIRRINTHEDFSNWLAVGQACADMQLAAMRLACASR
jgi:hypothetical protein